MVGRNIVKKNINELYETIQNMQNALEKLKLADIKYIEGILRSPVKCGGHLVIKVEDLGVTKDKQVVIYRLPNIENIFIIEVK